MEGYGRKSKGERHKVYTEKTERTDRIIRRYIMFVSENDISV